MSKPTDLDQLIDAVKRQPGARAYALLAEHYLDDGSVDEALRVCEAGFAVNPAYVRGAIAYLNALRDKRAADEAARVYGRAIAENPRSAELRLAWARILRDVGRQAEARLRLREAIEIDPTSRDVRALLDSVGGTPPPALRNTGGPGLEAARPAPRQPGQHAQGPPRTSPATTSKLPTPRPPVGPRGEGTAPHRLFDTSPGAAGFPRIGPLRKSERHDTGEPPSLNTLARFFEVPRPASPRPQSSSPPSPESESGPRSRSGTPPSPPPPPTTTRTDRVPHESAASHSAVPPMPSRTLLDEPPAPVAPSVSEASDLQVAPTLVDRPHRSAPRKMGWIVFGVALLLAGGVGAVWLYRHIQLKRANEQLAAAMNQTVGDRPEAYQRALRTLDTLSEKHPHLQPLQAARALISAHLAVRFAPAGDDAATRHAAKERLARARTVAPRLPWTRTAQALLALHRDRADSAPPLLPSGAAPDEDWHRRLVRGLSLEQQGKINEAVDVFSPTERGSTAIALVVEAARTARLDERWEDCRRLLTIGLSSQPGHTGLMLQQALLRAENGQPIKADTLSRLESAAGRSRRYEAWFKLLQARLARQSDDPRRAITLAHASVELSHSPNPEANWLAAYWRLATGDDLLAVTAALDQHGPAFERYRPRVALVRVRTLLRLGRPHGATALLGGIDANALSRTEDRNAYHTLRITAAHGVGDADQLRELCPTGLGLQQLHRLIACVESNLEGSRFTAAKRLVDPLRNAAKSTVATYLVGLEALAKGDSSHALRLLEPLDGSPPLDPVNVMLARAHAYMERQGVKPAIRALRAAMRHDGHSVRTRVALAGALVAAGHDSEAQLQLDKALAARPTDPRALAAIGRTYITLGRPTEAEDVVAMLREHAPHATATLMLAGRVALLNDRTDEARTSFLAALKREPDNAAALVELGHIAARKGRTRAAEKRFSAALRRRSSDPEILLLLARVYARMRRHNAASTTGLQAIELFEQSGRKQRAIEAMVIVGRALGRGDKPARQRARELVFRASISKNPPATALLELGRLHKKEGDAARALWSFRKAVRLDPLLASAQLELGLLLRSLRKKPREARRALQQYLEINPRAANAARVRSILSRLR